MRGYQYIGIRNWLLIIIFIISNITIIFFWPNQGFEWISFVICAFIIGTANLLILFTNKSNFDNKIISFLLFRLSWSYGFTGYMLFVEYDIIPSMGLGLIVLFSVLVFFDVLIVLFDYQIVQTLGPLFIPKNTAQN
ncbi:MAG: hypothetical protein ACW981_00815 [Candidatus Hodarchaeales archaeon]